MEGKGVFSGFLELRPPEATGAAVYSAGTTGGRTEFSAKCRK